MVASKDMLPQSTERIVEVQGSSESIGVAIEEIGRCLLEDWERGVGTVLFHPGAGDERSGRRPTTTGGRRSNGEGRGRTSPSPHSPSSPSQA